VLVADDDPVNRGLVNRLLDGLGFEVQQAVNGLEALQLIRISRPDLLITDLVMPVLDGMELIRALRSDEQDSQLPIIALSASASQYTREEALREGCSAFLSKPVRLNELLNEVQSELQLVWKFGSPTESATPARPAISTEQFLLDPSIAAQLYHIAMQGDVEGLIVRMRETLSQDPAAQCLCEEIQALAQQYDMSAIRRLLNTHAPA
jgi:CheY-like chemotaxis protein